MSIFRFRPKASFWCWNCKHAFVSATFVCSWCGSTRTSRLRDKPACEDYLYREKALLERQSQPISRPRMKSRTMFHHGSGDLVVMHTDITEIISEAKRFCSYFMDSGNDRYLLFIDLRYGIKPVVHYLRCMADYHEGLSEWPRTTI